MCNKIDDISLYLNKSGIDILCLSEHWVTNKEILLSANVVGFNLSSAFCRSHSIHGGVCIYVREGLHYKEYNVENYSIDKISEFCAIEILPFKILVISVYRSCASDINAFFVQFEHLLISIHDRFDRIVILGDFNIHFNLESNHVLDFKNILNSFGINITINEYTRINHMSASCIDNILTNINEDLYRTMVVNPSLSDHLGQHIIITYPERRITEKIYLRKITCSGLAKVQNALNELDWNAFYQSNDVEFMSLFLLENLQKLILEHFPIKTVDKRNKPVSWFTDELKLIRDRVAAAKTISDCSNNPEHKMAYRVLRKKYYQTIEETKKSSYDNFINNSPNKPKDIWKIINSERGCSKKSDHERCTISAKDFNNFFVDIATNIVSTLTICQEKQDECLKNIPLNQKSFFLKPISECDVLRTIENLKKTGSMDVYEINSLIIRDLKENFVPPLTDLFNKCIQLGIFPTSLKLSKVIPVFKKGDPNDPSDYRPISLIPIIGKIFEYLIKEQLSDYFESLQCLCDGQFGFRPGCSTIHAVSRVVHGVVECFEKGEHVGLTLCDLSKAFDCVSHELLLEKLFRYGVRGLPLRLLQSYLHNRQQSVYVNGSKSCFETIKCGVPQGSVLGPLLFVIYINDLYHYVSPVKCTLYADDTSFIVSNKDIVSLNNSLIKLNTEANSWFENNTLKLNVEKTQKLILSTNPLITVGNTVKILGITVDDQLTWTSHVNLLTKKLASATFALRRLSNLLHISSLVSAYYSLVHSHLSYGVLLWGNSSSAIKAFRSQKKAIRVIAKAGYFDHCKPIFQRFRIMPLPTLYIYYQLLEIHKNKELFILNSDVHTYPTRNCDHIRPNRYKYKKSATNSLDVGLYNVLPVSVKNSTFSKFKQTIKNYLCKFCFYSTHEYYMHTAVSTFGD